MKYLIYRNGGYVCDWDRQGGCDWVGDPYLAHAFETRIGAEMAMEDLDINDALTEIVEVPR